MTGDLSLALLAFSFSVAAALGPYAALTALGVAAWAGVAPLPAPLSGLAAPQVWGPLAGLLAVDLAVTRRRIPDLLWNAMHTVVRPLAASLIAGATLSGWTQGPQWIAALAGLGVGAVLHLQILGLRTVLRTVGGAWTPMGLAVGLALVGAGLPLLAVHSPANGATVAGLLLVLPLPWAPPLWRAALMLVRAWWAAGFRGGRSVDWRAGTDVLGPGLDRRLTLAPAAAARLRCIPVTLATLRGRWIFRRGFLALADEDLLFLRADRRGSALELARGEAGSDGASVVETVRVGGSGRYNICLDAEAPAGGAILAVLQPRGRGVRKGTLP